MKMTLTLRRGETGWAAIGATVLLSNLLLDETCCAAFRRALRSSPAGALALSAAWGLLTAHVFGILPARRDPFVIILRFASSTCANGKRQFDTELRLDGSPSR